MKFRDPETGKVFENIEAAMNCFCYESLRVCNKCDFYRKNCGMTWVCDHPAEAARLMGYEVIDDSSTEIDESPTDTPTTLDDTPTVSGDRTTEEDDMGKQENPRLAEILGVEEDKTWGFPGMNGPYRIHHGKRQYKWNNSGDWYDCHSEDDLALIINHPERIIRTPRLTEAEIAIMRAVGAKWVSFDTTSIDETVMLWSDKPNKDGNGDFSSPISILATVTAELFPSVKPGECIGLKEAKV